MASTSICSTLLPTRPFSGTRKMVQKQEKRVSAIIFASKREAHDQNYHNGRIVDENLIVLRKRIHEMKMVERNYDPPSEWMDWEKRIYTSYDEIICEAMGLLQSQLMNTRPCLALGILALISLSVPTAAAVVVSQFLEMSKDVLGHVIHLS